MLMARSTWIALEWLLFAGFVVTGTLTTNFGINILSALSRHSSLRDNIKDYLELEQDEGGVETVPLMNKLSSSKNQTIPRYPAIAWLMSFPNSVSWVFSLLAAAN
jgi:hypothetical protein